MITANYKSKYDKENFEYINSLYRLIQNSIESIDKNKQDIKNNLIKIEEAVETAKSRLRNYEEEFQKVKREMCYDTEFDLDDFRNWKNDINENDETLRKLQSSVMTKEDSIQKIKYAMKLYEDSRKKAYKRHKEQIEQINTSQTNKINIEITYKGDKKKFTNDIAQEFSIKPDKAEIISNSFIDFVQLVYDVLVDESKKLKVLNLTDKQKKSIEDHIREGYESILQFSVNDQIVFKYKNKRLENYSLGQRAMALMNLILAQNDSDIIIIDQPEDDLDSQVIYNELIASIKKIKNNVQLIFATHNANIPVLGDAERVVELKVEGTNKVKVVVGNIDSERSQTAIIKIMEGGREAFKKRNSIYNMWA